MSDLSRAGFVGRVIQPALLSTNLAFLAFGLLLVPELALLSLHGARPDEFLMATALIVVFAAIAAALLGILYFSGRLLHALLARSGMVGAALAPGLVMFLWFGFPAARWISATLPANSLAWELSFDLLLGVISVLVGLVLILFYPRLRDTNTIFAPIAALAGCLLVLPFDGGLWGMRAGWLQNAAAAGVLTTSVYVALRARFAHHTALLLQVQRPAGTLLWFLGLAALAGALGCVTLGLHLPNRTTFLEGASASLLGLVFSVGFPLLALAWLHLLGASRRIRRGDWRRTSSAFWFAPASVLFAVSALLHIVSASVRPEQVALLRAHGLLSYDLWALVRAPVTPVLSSRGQQDLDRPALADVLAPQTGAGAQTQILLTIIGARSVPETTDRAAVFLGTDAPEYVLTRLLGTGGTQPGVISRFAESDYRTICGGVDGGRAYLRRSRLHVGCQVFVPLTDPPDTDLTRTVNAMLQLAERYRERRTLLWIHHESKKPAELTEVRAALAALEAKGPTLIVATEVEEPSLGFVFPNMTNTSLSEEPRLGRLSREHRPSPLLALRAAIGRLPEIEARAAGGRLLLRDPAGEAHWERELRIPKRAAAGVGDGAGPSFTQRP